VHRAARMPVSWRLCGQNGPFQLAKATFRAHDRGVIQKFSVDQHVQHQERRNMTFFGSSNSVRPESALEEYGPRFGEYPISLRTRRTYSLQAEGVVNRRESAPNALWFDARSNPTEPGERMG
jgi:hypothetical protein